MKIIKKISLMAAVVAFGSFASAAMSDYNIYVGVGVGMFKPKNKFDNEVTGDAGKELISYKNKVGYSIGALGYIKMADMVSLRTGAFYSMKNFKASDGAATTPKEKAVKLSYIEVPITLAYSMNRMAHIYAGANVSYKVGYSEDKVSGDAGVDLIKDDNIKSLLITGTVGGQFNVMDRLGVDIFAELGFGSILDIDKPAVSTAAVSDDKEIAKSPLGFGARVLYRF